MSLHVHLLVPDLFLPRGVAAGVGAGLRLPALEKILARALVTSLAVSSQESWLCAAFGVEGQGVAPITLQADGGQPGTAYWLRADPVYLMPGGEQFIPRPVMTLGAEEAAQLCASLNRHFADEGLHFAVPQPQRWYLGMERAPAINTISLSQVEGNDLHSYLPQGADALRWHTLLNEIQMLLFDHPVNRAREARGDWPVNSLWPWGGGYAPEKLAQPFTRVYSDSPLVAAFAQVAGIRHSALPVDAMRVLGERGTTLIVWDGLRHAWQYGDLGGWRDSLLLFEHGYARPLLRALQAGRIGSITLDIAQLHAARRLVLTRGRAWQFWRSSKRLEFYALV